MDQQYIHILEVVLATLFGLVLSFTAYWVKHLDVDLKTVDVRISKIEDQLSAYKEKHAVGETQLAAIRSLLADHVDREENVTWKRIDEIDRENQMAHQKMFDGLSSLHGDVRELVGIMTTQFKLARTTRKERA
jgi:hypothetical protein